MARDVEPAKICIIVSLPRPHAKLADCCMCSTLQHLVTIGVMTCTSIRNLLHIGVSLKEPIPTLARKSDGMTQDRALACLAFIARSPYHACHCFGFSAEFWKSVSLSGLQERRHDPRRGMSLLVEDWVSAASALQRRGRAGRVRPGMCWGLYTRHRFEHRLRRYQVISLPITIPQSDKLTSCV